MSYKRPPITDDEMTDHLYNEITNYKLYIYQDWRKMRNSKRSLGDHQAIRNRIRYYIHRIHVFENMLFIIQSHIHRSDNATYQYLGTKRS